MMEPTFLTPEEIQRLTGRKRAKCQLEVLAVEGIPATRDADGKPIVNRRVYESLHLGRKQRVNRAPNMDAL